MLEKVFAAYRCGDFVVLPGSRQILRDGEPVEHEAKVFDLMVLLLEHHDRALAKQEIITALWGNRPVTDAALSQLVYKARRALGDDQRRIIRTVHGRGLQWVAPIEVLDEVPPPCAGSTPGPYPRAPTGLPAGRKRWRLTTFALLLLLVLAGLAWIAVPRNTLHGPTIAVMPIENVTGDPTLEWTRLGLAALLTSELQRAGVDGVDVGQVARLVEQAPAGPEAGAHIRRGSGAMASVGGRLQRHGELLRLDLQVERGDRRTHLHATGIAPAQLAVSLAGEIDALLGTRRPASAAAHAPANWLAETHARGMDLAVRSRWAEAKPYFLVCVQQDPDFRDARLNLARMQARSGEEGKARSNLETLIATGDGSAPDTLRARMELAMLSVARGDRTAAIRELQALRIPTAGSGIASLPAWVEMNLAQLLGEVGRTEEADTAFMRAAAIIREHRLRNYEPRLYNIASAMAEAQGNLPAAREANRRVLQVTTALGDRQGALGAALNVAALDVEDGHPLRALPLLVHGWRDAVALDAVDERLFAGQTLAEALLRLGAVAQAAPLIRHLRALAVQRAVPHWLATQQAIEAVALRLAGAPQRSLEHFEAISDVLEGADRDAFVPRILPEQALAAWDAGDAAALQRLAGHAHALLPGAAAPQQLAAIAQGIQALALARRGETAAARELLDAADRVAARDAVARQRLLAARLRIASDGEVATHIDEAGQFDVSTNEDVDVLTPALAMARAAQNQTVARQLQDRLESLQRAAASALEGLDIVADSYTHAVD
ncbi:winged helix-turn-helix domain-containing protein [Dokdonella sp.]|uniref:winged helix-turn-helix domain-containing protein n=1 Tax=Dokdonella sp. TaxID=2291710 RepID=UPI0031CB8A86|nr:winged helix-turn-helix domain-containing protein [Dokdonella sp.]